jgi:hypothetical protein
MRVDVHTTIGMESAQRCMGCPHDETRQAALRSREVRIEPRQEASQDDRNANRDVSDPFGNPLKVLADRHALAELSAAIDAGATVGTPQRGIRPIQPRFLRQSHGLERLTADGARRLPSVGDGYSKGQECGLKAASGRKIPRRFRGLSKGLCITFCTKT